MDADHEEPLIGKSIRMQSVEEMQNRNSQQQQRAGSTQIASILEWRCGRCWNLCHVEKQFASRSDMPGIGKLGNFFNEQRARE